MSRIPEPPAPGEAIQLGLETIRARRCRDPKCPCGQVTWYFVYRRGRLVAGGTDWPRLMHTRGHWPLEGLQLGDRVPRLDVAVANKKPPKTKADPQRPLLTQAELEQMEPQHG